VSSRRGTHVQCHLAHARRDAGEAEVLCRIMRRQLERRRVGEDRPRRHGYVDLAEMRLAVRGRFHNPALTKVSSGRKRRLGVAGKDRKP
jgi:hypothetical protein